jgi:hypothetical protein
MIEDTNDTEHEVRRETQGQWFRRLDDEPTGVVDLDIENILSLYLSEGRL